MHVGLNCVFLVPGETGGLETYARELARALTDIRVTAFVSRAAADGSWPVETITVPGDPRHRVQWVAAEQLLLPRLANETGIDVLHSLASTAPVLGRFRRAVTIHDLAYRTVPEAHQGLRSLGMRILVPLAAHRSHLVIADSRSARGDLIRRLRLAPERVEVVYPGPGHSPAAVGLSADETRAHFELADREVVVSLSALRPHKNLARLLEALALMEEAERPLAILPGYPTAYERELRALAARLGLLDFVRFPGWIAEAELEGLFNVAGAFVFPSLYEGFGLPVLEAMVRGVPVACSDIPVLVEVVGDAALLFDPLDPRGMADAIRRLIRDGDLRSRLVAAGKARAARFSWKRTAEGVVAAYDRVLSS
jgi:glycosyltransferase involved in cell wall biosynthesis